ncbi:2-dehydropantoate 2-reductase [Paraflavitalea soli]|uniref:2-dehydropantoate 2-reductase n=2 Tax=Paraflavitalea soli TaxID=2315862 RepID=A0A3B7MST1_9BACT|nr:2-dehydropantoate 2-reductase [Paraflavitalea soli]
MKVMEQIYIIGAGAVGKVLAVTLALNNRKVVLLRGSVDNQGSYIENIQVTTAQHGVMEANIEVSSLSNVPVLNGLVVLTNKSFGNAGLAQALKGKTGDSPIVLLQNGLGVEQVFIDHSFPQVYRCVLFMTSQVMAENKISFKPVAVSPIGLIKGGDNQLNNIVAQLNCPQFGFRTESNIQPIIWKKAIANSVFNSICPLLDIDNGIFCRDEGVMAMASRVIKECVGIAQAKGVAITEAEVTETVLMISRLSDGQLISTLQDINHKRPTEIETLNFAMVDIAQSLQLGYTVTETKLLGELTKWKSDLHRL